MTIAAGLARFDLGLFLLAAVITRSGRFFLEAALLQHPKVKAVFERHLVPIVIGVVVLAAVGLLALKLLHIG